MRKSSGIRTLKEGEAGWCRDATCCCTRWLAQLSPQPTYDYRIQTHSMPQQLPHSNLVERSLTLFMQIRQFRSFYYTTSIDLYRRAMRRARDLRVTYKLTTGSHPALLRKAHNHRGDGVSTGYWSISFGKSDIKAPYNQLESHVPFQVEVFSTWSKPRLGKERKRKERKGKPGVSPILDPVLY